MSTEKISYNIPGCGTLTANLFPHAKSLFDFLDHYGHIERLKRINQLGKLRDVYQGAHHTRYEYVFLQLVLISELCNNKKADLGLSPPREFCGKLRELPSYPSSGDLLQCLALLTNIGYTEGTIAASRAWLTFLKENKPAFKSFSSGLEKQDKVTFEMSVKEFDYGRFNLYSALFQLQRYKRYSREHVEFATSLLRLYLKYEQKNFTIIRLKGIYAKIRQISFITLDSLYTPVPFNLELSSILLGFNYLYESLFTKNAIYSVALNTLENVLQDTVYLSVDSCLNTSYATNQELKHLRTHLGSSRKLSSVTSYLLPGKALMSNPGPNQQEAFAWQCRIKTVQEYIINRGKDDLPQVINNPIVWETECQNRIGKSFSRVGLLTNKKNSTIKLAFGLSSIENSLCQKGALRIVSEALKFRNTFNHKFINRKEEENRNALISFLMRSLFGWEKRVILSDRVKKCSAYIIENGRVKFIAHINEYLEQSRGILTPSETFEIKQLKQFVERLQYAGLTIGYIGKSRLFNEGVNTECAEFDGLIFQPTKNPHSFFAYIIEAKDQASGATKARQQLQRRLQENLSDHLTYDLNNLNSKCCVASIKLA